MNLIGKLLLFSITLFTFSLFLSGCQNQSAKTYSKTQSHSQSSAQPHGSYASDDDKLPPIAFYGKEKSLEFQLLCQQQLCDNDYALGSKVLQQLRESGHFTQVNYDDAQLDYAVHLAISEIKEQSLIQNRDHPPAKANEQHQIRAEFIITWKNAEISHYTFILPYSKELALADVDVPLDTYIAHRITEQFLNATVNDAIFGGEYLYQALAASDYQNNLHYPDNVGDFVFSDRYVFNHPLEGIQLNYVHKVFDFDRYDVFIYPIQLVDWSNTDKTLSDELDILLREIDIAKNQGFYEDVEILDISNTQIQLNGQNIAGKSLHLQAKTKDQLFSSYVYLFSQEDKFIKFRVFYQITEEMVTEPSALAFVKAVLPELEVPKESFFMTQLRNQYQKTLFNKSVQ